MLQNAAKRKKVALVSGLFAFGLGEAPLNLACWAASRLQHSPGFVQAIRSPDLG
jgi:hypothetical protein